MTQQERLNKFINDRCSKCKNKETNKCNIVTSIKGKLQCTEEERA